jgi:hypothetical protein
MGQVGTVSGESMYNKYRKWTFAEGGAGVTQDPAKNPAARGDKEGSITMGGGSQFGGLMNDMNVSLDAPIGRGAMGLDLFCNTIAQTTITDDGIKGSNFTNQHMHVKLGYGKEIIEKHLSAGVNVSYTSEALPGDTQTAISGDVGLLYKFSPILGIGLSGRNVIQGPTEATLGAAYTPATTGDVKLKASADLDYALSGPTRTGLGLEAKWKYLKAGIGYNNLNGLTAGLGIESSNFGIDFVYASQKELGASPQATVFWKFGGLKAEGKISAFDPQKSESCTKIIKVPKNAVKATVRITNSRGDVVFEEDYHIEGSTLKFTWDGKNKDSRTPVEYGDYNVMVNFKDVYAQDVVKASQFFNVKAGESTKKPEKSNSPIWDKE